MSTCNISYVPPANCTCLSQFQKKYMANHYSLKGIFTTMIGFVTWPPFLIINVEYNKKGGQVTKPIIVVKIPFKL